MTEFRSRPRPFVLSSSEHGAMIVNIHDHNNNPGIGEYGVGHQILSTGVYDPAEVNLIRQIIDRLRADRGSKLIFLDCGANIGVMTLEMAAYAPDCQVMAFEAQERLFYALCGNIALANLFNAQARLIALGNDCGRLRVPHPNYCKPGSFGSLELRFRENTEHIGQSINYSAPSSDVVPLATLDSFGLPRADFIKLDVEGMELEVLEGARETISTFKPVLLIEWIKSSQEGIRKFLTPFGYESFIVSGMNLLCTA